MRFNIHHKLRASSLMEVLISMVILLVVFGIGLMIFTNVILSSKSEESKKVEQRMAVLAQQALEEGASEEMELDAVHYQVNKEILPQFSDRIRISVLAMNTTSGKIIDSLIVIKEYQDEK
ncbi:hypothetical protein LZQ00_10055 [Sphingobacterium sp. SRCM116780]|uniref:type IV pilus modification PilV family protein n=1 Tax=Sphingobacterium sp. SRCM116780 TaxID=2907623 RepID=UPI001F1CC19D|nr:hypothetical protein [Sphingobacterium sp. SRCM116780]UIR54617.1 hypothetical protein LZQ00_10055 [Sphingobacterium sp. SRCM116780]